MTFNPVNLDELFGDQFLIVSLKITIDNFTHSNTQDDFKIGRGCRDIVFSLLFI